MNLLALLSSLAAVVDEEARVNEPFRCRLRAALSEAATALGEPPKEAAPRRADPALDPIQVLREGGEDALRARLQELDLDALRDVVARHGMDPSKLVLRWKSCDRIVAHVVQFAVARAAKGSAFRKPAGS